jgi:hypothetical protein
MSATEQSGKSVSPLLFLGAYSILGLLVGHLVGFSSDSIAKSLIPALFAFGGGSVLVFLGRLPGPDRAPALLALLGMSGGCLLGIYLALYVDAHKLLSPSTPGVVLGQVAGSSPGDFYYLHDAAAVSQADAIDAKRRAHDLTCEDAFSQLYRLAKTGRAE